MNSIIDDKILSVFTYILEFYHLKEKKKKPKRAKDRVLLKVFELVLLCFGYCT